MMTTEQLNERLDKIASREEEIEKEKVAMKDWFMNATSLEMQLKIQDNLKASNDMLLGIQEERRMLLNLMTTQLEKGLSSSCVDTPFQASFVFQKGVFVSPSKKMRRSLPPPTSGSKWTFDILRAYLINIRKTFSLDDFLFQPAPSLSGESPIFL